MPNGSRGVHARLGPPKSGSVTSVATKMACAASPTRLAAIAWPPSRGCFRHHHACALGGKRPRGRGADALAGAGDDRAFSSGARPSYSPIDHGAVGDRTRGAGPRAEGMARHAASSTSMPSPGASGICQKPSHHADQAPYDLAVPGHGADHLLLDHEIGRCDVEVQAATLAIGPSGLCGATPTGRSRPSRRSSSPRAVRRNGRCRAE